MAKASNNVNSNSDIIVQPEYKEFLHEVKQRIKSSQAKAALAVNRSLIQLYWGIGKLIAEKQTAYSWGTNIIEQLSLDLKTEFPAMSGFSPKNLRCTKQFYLFYSSPIWQQAVAKLGNIPSSNPIIAAAEKETSDNQSLIILRQLVAEIPWGHHLLILNKINDPEEALFYIRQTIEHNWSRNMLTFHIEQKLFSRQGMGMSNFKETLPTPQAILAEQMLKDPYNFSFLTLEPKVQELDLEKQLTEHITRFLLELGKGFAYIGRQYPLKIGEKEYWIDLLFYHIRLRCFVVIDLKVTPFEPEHAGKMNFYLSAVDDLLKTEADHASIGIVLCKSKGAIEVEYALRGISKPIGVSEFVLTEALPDELRPSIPTVEEFEQEINRL
jgi:predicted nuclease of restriction endonuclease-like (RecB) superfamily